MNDTERKRGRKVKKFMIHDMILSLGQHHQVLIMNQLIHKRDDHDYELITNEDTISSFCFLQGESDERKSEVKRERERSH